MFLGNDMRVALSSTSTLFRVYKPLNLRWCKDGVGGGGHANIWDWGGIWDRPWIGPWDRPWIGPWDRPLWRTFEKKNI